MPEPKPNSRERNAHARRICTGLKRAYPQATCALVHANPYELLVATILSAQCTDARVNMVTPELFRRYPDAQSLARAVPSDLEALIRSTGFFRAKARSLLAMAQRIVLEHGGSVPADLDALTALPGVGRKTANVVLGTAFGIASGVVVDTHVKRLARRMGLTSKNVPEQIERDLMELLPRREWIDLSHRLILHGRRVCAARAPKCAACSLEPICPQTGVTPPRSKPPARPRQGRSPTPNAIGHGLTVATGPYKEPLPAADEKKTSATRKPVPEGACNSC